MRSQDNQPQEQGNKSNHIINLKNIREMKKEYIVATNGYTMIDGELVNVVFNTKVAKGDNIIYTTDKGKELVNAVTYASAQKFEKGEPSQTKATLPWGLRDLRINEQGEIEVWTMQNGQPVSEWKDVDVRVFGYIQPILQEGEYLSREECLKHNTYIEVDLEGNKVEHIGICKKLELNEEQKAYLNDELIPILNKSRELGLYFVYDSGSDELRVVNTKNIKVNLSSDYGTPPSDGVGICELPSVKHRASMTYYSDDAYLYDGDY